MAMAQQQCSLITGQNLFSSHLIIKQTAYLSSHPLYSPFPCHLFSLLNALLLNGLPLKANHFTMVCFNFQVNYGYFLNLAKMKTIKCLLQNLRRDFGEGPIRINFPLSI